MSTVPEEIDLRRREEWKEEAAAAPWNSTSRPLHVVQKMSRRIARATWNEQLFDVDALLDFRRFLWPIHPKPQQQQQNTKFYWIVETQRSLGARNYFEGLWFLLNCICWWRRESFSSRVRTSSAKYSWQFLIRQILLRSLLSAHCAVFLCNH